MGDAEAKALSELPKLEYLSLVSTPITDASLKKLANSPQLKRLAIGRTGVSSEAVQRLEDARPSLVVLNPPSY